MGLMEKFSLEGKTVLITGGSKGLGKAVALGLAEAGANIAVAARGIELCEDAAHEIAQKGVRTIAIETDVTKPDQVEKMVRSTVSEFGSLDVVFNNAGTAVVAPAEEMSYEDLTMVIDLNLVGLFLCCQSAARVMIPQKSGSIINMASMSAHVVNLPQKTSNYNASKAAVVQLTKNLAVEWAPHNIRVNVVSPGYHLTELAKSFSDELMRQWKEKIPMQRIADPSELAGAILFLASDASSYCTGMEMIIDGGYTLW